MDVQRRVIIDALHGIGVPYGHGDSLVNLGRARYTGDQHNPDWEWDETWIDTQSTLDLTNLYADILYGKYK